MKAAYFLIAIAIVMIFFMVELFDPFLKSIFVSLLLVVATSTLTLYLENTLKSRFFATAIMTIALTSLFFIPILYCIFSFADFFTKVDQVSLIKNLNDMKIIIQNSLKDFIFLNDLLTQIISKFDVAKTVQDMLTFGAYLGKNSVKFMMDMIMILIFFFFFTLYSSSIVLF
ncbi:MAG: AI-2E family transporter, partial [Campylobacterales bacterium]|nr:AI-2E family transporter [Campylobacterales bacterium]